MPTKPKHVHKLRRFKYKSGNILYFCTLPDCNYKVAPGLTLGKRSICNICDEEFIMNEYSIRLAKPHCEKCHKPKNPEIPLVIGNGNQPRTLADSLAERLNAVVKSAQPQEEEEI